MAVKEEMVALVLMVEMAALAVKVVWVEKRGVPTSKIPH